VYLTARDATGLATSLEIPVFVDAVPCASAVAFAPDETGDAGLLLDDDDVTAELPLGFRFRYFEQEFDSVRVASNGFLLFGEAGLTDCCSGQELPNPRRPVNRIAFAWTDWNPSAGGFIRRALRGQAPRRRFVVDFVMVPEFGGTGSVTTQIKLFEEDGAIEVHTRSLDLRARPITQGLESIDAALFLPGRALKGPMGPKALKAPNRPTELKGRTVRRALRGRSAPPALCGTPGCRDRLQVSSPLRA
jgi:hypothetical protein